MKYNPIIDQRKVNMINDDNYQEYLYDGLHPNSNDTKKIGRQLACEFHRYLFYPPLKLRLIMISLFFMFILSPILLPYFIYMVIREGLCKVCYLYFLAYTGWCKYRKCYRYPLSILALKKLNFIFAKYTLYRLFDV